MFWLDHPMELIAAINSPAGLRGAINAGANAVVVDPVASGFPGDAKILADIVSDTHLYGLNIYASVETLFTQSKLIRGLQILGKLFTLGIDGVYISDVGLFERAASAFKEMPLFAGPMMGIHNRQGIRWARDLGAKRIALDASLDLPRIGIIARSEKLPLEVFLHGARCFGFPGLCRLSNSEEDVSQADIKHDLTYRKPFRAMQLNGEQIQDFSFIFGAQDKWFLEHLPSLARIGIRAGRVGSVTDDPVYTATVVGVYRKALEEIYEGNFKNYYELSDLKRLRAVFNRESSTRSSTGGYFIGPRHVSQRLATVERASTVRKRIVLQLEDSIAMGDKVVILGANGRVSRETTVRNITAGGHEQKIGHPGDLVEINFSGAARAGDAVYKTVDSELVRQVKSSLINLAPKRFVAISAELKAGKSLKVTARAGNQEGLAESASSLERSRGKGIGTEQIARMLTNMRGTPFRIENMQIKLHEPVDVPAREIPNLKKQALTDLEKGLRERFTRKIAWQLPDITPIPSVVRLHSHKLLVKVNSFERAKAAVGAGAKIVYFPIDSPEFKKAQAMALSKNVRLFAFAEALLDDREVVEAKKPFRKGNISTLLTGNCGLARWGLMHARVEAHLDYTARIGNTSSYYYWQKLGVKLQTVSVYMSVGELRHLVAPDTAVMIHGRLPAGFTKTPAQLPEGSDTVILEDRQGQRLVLNQHKSGLTVLMTDRPVGLFEEAFRLKKMGFQNFRLDFFDESPDKVHDIIEEYRHILNGRRQPSAKLRPSYIQDVYPR